MKDYEYPKQVNGAWKHHNIKHGRRICLWMLNWHTLDNLRWNPVNLKFAAKMLKQGISKKTIYNCILKHTI